MRLADRVPASSGQVAPGKRGGVRRFVPISHCGGPLAATFIVAVLTLVDLGVRRRRWRY